MQPVAPRGLVLRARRRRRCARARLRGRRPRRRPARRRARSRRRRARHRPPVRAPSGSAPCPAARRVLQRRRARRDRGVRRAPAAASSSSARGAGEVRHQPRRAARALRHRDRQRHRPGLRAPPQRRRTWVLADLATASAAPAATCSPASSGAASTAPATLDVAAAPAPHGPRPHLADRLDARARRWPPSPSTARAASSVLADSDLFGDDCLGELGHAALWLNLVHWARRAGVRAPRRAAVASARAADPHWRALQDATDALRLLQEPDGSVDSPRTTRRRPRPRRGDGRGDRRRSRRTSRTRPTTSSAVVADLRAWARRRLRQARLHRARSSSSAPTCSAPTASSTSSSSRCTCRTRSRDTRFEALHRPRAVAGVARRARARRATTTRSSCRSTFVDHTAGYDSRVRGAVPRDGRRRRPPGQPLRRDLLRPRGRALPPRRRARPPTCCGSTSRPTPRRCCAPSALSRDAYMLWDLVHDRAHSHGDLPFDPFMIRQRMPYWMYSLEELRCDLTAFGEAVELEREGFAFARHVQYAILFDRLFRFPITGLARAQLRRARRPAAVRLPAQARLRALDRQPPDDRVGPRRRRRRRRCAREVEELYRAGIDRSKLAHWIAAHDLVARYVPPAAGSRWAAGTRATSPTSRTRARTSTWSLPDEFPLSMFYISLKAKLEPVLARPRCEPARWRHERARRTADRRRRRGRRRSARTSSGALADARRVGRGRRPRPGARSTALGADDARVADLLDRRGRRGLGRRARRRRRRSCTSSAAGAAARRSRTPRSRTSSCSTTCCSAPSCTRRARSRPR